MLELKKFQEKVEAYRRNAPTPHTQKELAEAIPLDKDELSKRLNAYKRSNRSVSPLTNAQVYAIIRVLARWGAIETQEQAKDLLDLMECPHFSSSDWKTHPLRLLRSSTVPSTIAFSAPDRTDTQRKREKFDQLRMMQVDHAGFLRNRLESFVGREAELAEIRQLISAMVPTGGYLTITGQTGQGKSSIIAKLVDGYGLAKIAHHFIPPSPGPDYQITLLRDIMARLILKHNLSDLYIASESRPVLRDFFSKALIELSGKERREVIFIDGLDQLKEDGGDERDLSFLPYHLPPGVVVVLGTRPDDTLRDLRTGTPPSEYRLPNLSRQDFDLILKHRGVQLDKRLADRFYQAMQENALYLDLVAKELAQKEIVDPEQIIQRLADNPANIFSLSIDRLKQRESQWDKVIYPVLGLLLAAQEPLSLQHIRQILKVEDYRLKDGLARLGGLVVEDGQHRYSLYHVKLYDYLQQDEDRPGKEYVFAKQEEEQWHKKLVAWCEQGGLSTIWVDMGGNSLEQGRRVYARNHYVTHLYLAREWDRLFEVLDTGYYGRAKLRHSFSMHPYVQDLGRGQRAAACVEGDTPDFLPRLWRYTLLRCSLNSRADQYPSEAFSALVLMKREKEAIDLAKLLTEPEKRARALLQIATHLRDQPEWEQEHLQLLDDVYEIVQSVEESEEKASVLQSLCAAFTEVQLWDRAEAVAYMAKDDEKKAWMLQRLGIALVESRQWKRAKTIASTIVKKSAKASVLQRLGTSLAQSHRQESAEEVWTEAETVIRAIEDDDDREFAVQSLCAELIKAHQWERASTIAQSLKHNISRAQVSQNLCVELAREQRYEQAEAIAEMIEYDRGKAMAFLMLGIRLAQAGYQDRAEGMWARAMSVTHAIEEDKGRSWSLHELGIVLAEAQQEEQAAAIWDEAEAIVRSVGESSAKIVMLQQLAVALIKARRWRRAGAALTETARLICTTEERKRDAWALQHLCTLLAQAQQWEQAEAFAETIEDERAKAWALRELCEELTLAQQWKRAEEIAQTIADNRERARALLILCAELAFAQQWEEAEAVWTKVPTINRVIKEEGEARASALQELGVALAKLQQPAQAEAVLAEAETTIYAIEDVKARSWPLRGLCISLAQAQQWERAEAMVPEIEDSTARAWTLIGLCSVLAQAGQWERAESLADAIDIDSSKATALQELGILFSQARQWKRAESVLAKAGMLVQKTEGNQAKAWALQRQGIALAIAQKQDQAEAVLVEAEAVARTIEERITRDGVLQEICWALALADRWQRAEAIASTIEDGNVQANILLRLGMALAQTQQWNRAEVIAHKIDQSRARVGALQSLAMALIKAKQWNQAGTILAKCENLVDTIEEHEDRAFAHLKLGIALALALQRERAEIMWTEAETAADKITLTETKMRTLAGFCTLYAQAQEWTRAKTVANSIEQHQDKARALIALAAELVQAQQWSQVEVILAEAETLVYSLKNNQDKVILFNRIFDVLEMAGKYEKMLRLVQGVLQQATSRIYAIRLLSLINRLLPLKPELGIVYCEAFTWVASFLAK